MNHQPFKNWMFSDEPLTPEQIKVLDAHLATCESCRSLSNAWVEVRTVLHSSQTIQPAINFAERWQARLVEQSENLTYRKQRQSWWFFFIAAGLAFLFLVVLTAQVISSFDSPTAIFLSGLYLFTEAIESITTLQGLVSVLLNTLITVVPPAWWIFMMLLLCGLITIWLASLRRIVYPRRISQ
jgi:predicted anti-sigma-YlaC factor YlaD